MARIKNTELQTHSGHPLTQKEELFIQNIVKGKSNSDAVREAGFETNTPPQFATQLLKKLYISEEIKYRMDKLNQDAEETGRRLFEFWWRIVEGKEKDQFGLEADLNTRIKASQEIAKRVIDLQNKVSSSTAPEIKITLDWGENK